MRENFTEKLIRIGTETKWGEVTAVGRIEGYRYYWIKTFGDKMVMIPEHMIVNGYNINGH